MRVASSSLNPRARSASYRSPRCCASSSTISSSRPGSRRASARCLRTSLRQSRILHPRDLADGSHELLPAVPLCLERPLTTCRDAVVAPPPLTGLLHPSPLDPPSALHAIEHRVQRRDVKVQHAVGARLDQPAQIVAVPRLVLEQREDEKFGAPSLQFGREHGAGPGWRSYMVSPYILLPRLRTSRVWRASAHRLAIRLEEPPPHAADRRPAHSA